MSAYLQPGTSDRDEYFDLPDAGEDEADEPLHCENCGVPLNSTDFAAEFCTQCQWPINYRHEPRGW